MNQTVLIFVRKNVYLYIYICLDPTLWSEWEVNHWLDWCQAEFGLQCLGMDLRGLQGSELCALDREAFLDLTSDCTAGEILWEHLDTMRRGNTKSALFAFLVVDIC